MALTTFEGNKGEGSYNLEVKYYGITIYGNNGNVLDRFSH